MEGIFQRIPREQVKYPVVQWSFFGTTGRLYGRGEKDKIIQTPIKNRRKRDILEVLWLHPQGSRAEPQFVRHIHQIAQARSLQRQAKALGHGIQVESVPMKLRHHGHRSSR